MTELYSGLHVGQRFSSLEDFKALVRSISVRQHWELRVTRSNKKSVVIGCRSSNNCFFRVVCRANKNSTYISSLQDNHSCQRNATSSSKTPARSEASHVRFLLSEIPKLFDMRSKIKAQDIVDAVKRYHGYDISTRQAQRALIRLQQRNSQNASDGANTSSGEDRQESQPPPLDGQGDSSAYSSVPGQRWVPEPHQPNVIPQNEAQRNPTVPPPTLPAQPLPPSLPPVQHPQPAPPGPIPPPPTPQVHHQPLEAAIPQEQTSISHPTHPHPSSQQSPYPIPTPSQVPTRPPGRPKSPTQFQQPPGHASAPTLVLTNFKIEFTCTSCGALNQSFFPNQGNVTGRGYMPQQQGPDQTTTPSATGPPTQTAQHNEAATERGVDTHRYDRGRRPSTRGVQPPWTPRPGPLEAPMPSAHSHSQSKST